MFFDTWTSLFRIMLIGVLGYTGTVVLMRMSGNRTLSKMNSFNLVVTVAFGSTLSSLLIDSKVSLSEGLMAIAMLVGLQFIVTWLSVRSPFINRIVKTQPTLLVNEGRFLHHAMKRVRVTEDEIKAAVRKNGLGSMEKAVAVVMESDGSLSVIAVESKGQSNASHGVYRYGSDETGYSGCSD